MSVPVENRPESRLRVVDMFNNLMYRIMNDFRPPSTPSNTFYSMFFQKVFDSMIEFKVNIRTMNSCNVFDKNQFRTRQSHQFSALDCLNRMKCVFEMMVLIDDGRYGNKYESIIRQTDEVHKALTSLIKGDKERHAKGKSTVQEEYRQLKKRKYFVEKTYDNGSPTMSEMQCKDRFDVRGAIFESAPMEISDEQFRQQKPESVSDPCH